MNSKVQHYLLEQHCSMQWRFFLRAMAAVFSNNLTEEELRNLMRDIGRQAADSLGIQAHDYIQDLENELNQVWQTLGWGLVELTEQDHFLDIRHYASPLEAICGTGETSSWTGGFLEGLYGQLFRSLGAGQDLVVKQVPSHDPIALTYRLGRESEI